MRAGWTSVGATGLLLASVVMFTIGIWLGTHDEIDPVSVADAVWGVSFLAFPVIGWILAVKLPRNALGWIYLAIPLLVAVGLFTQEWAAWQADRGADAITAVVIEFGNWVFSTGVWLIVAGLMLFPDGALPGKRWRWALWVPVVALVVLGALGAASRPTVCVQWSALDDCLISIVNPLHVAALPGDGAVADALGGFVMLGALALGFASLIARYLRSGGDVRRQLKWVAWAASVGVLALITATLVEDVAGASLGEWPGVLAFAVISVGVPISMAVAIFKYRLYEIDRIINRTVVYAVVVALLGVVFVAGAVWLPSLLPFEDNSVAVAASTLVVFFLFDPVRRRVQRFVDRRFYRSRYDAKQVADAFSVRLRDQVDPDLVASEWAEVVQRTLQPASVSVWVPEQSS